MEARVEGSEIVLAVEMFEDAELCVEEALGALEAQDYWTEVDAEGREVYRAPLSIIPAALSRLAALENDHYMQELQAELAAARELAEWLTSVQAAADEAEEWLVAAEAAADETAQEKLESAALSGDAEAEAELAELAELAMKEEAEAMPRARRAPSAQRSLFGEDE